MVGEGSLVLVTVGEGAVVLLTLGEGETVLVSLGRTGGRVRLGTGRVGIGVVRVAVLLGTPVGAVVDATPPSANERRKLPKMSTREAAASSRPHSSGRTTFIPLLLLVGQAARR
jgi:hypothetical protein